MADCTDGKEPLVVFGRATAGLNPVTTYPSRPFVCEGSFPDQTPVLLGPSDPSFKIFWSGSRGSGSASTGTAKFRYRDGGDLSIVF
jgi:hypothetical protein